MEALETDARQPTQQDRPLILIAFVGYVSWLFTQTWIPKEGIGAQLFYAVIGGGLGLGTLLVAFPRGTTVLLQNLGLLAPYGCLLAVLTALHVAPVRMAQFHLVAPLDFFQQGFAAVALALAMFWVTTVYIAWQTLAIVDAVTDGRIDLRASLRRAVTLWPRTLAVVFVAYFVLMLPLMLGMLLSAPIPPMPPSCDKAPASNTFHTSIMARPSSTKREVCRKRPVDSAHSAGRETGCGQPVSAATS